MQVATQWHDLQLNGATREKKWQEKTFSKFWFVYPMLHWKARIMSVTAQEANKM